MLFFAGVDKKKKYEATIVNTKDRSISILIKFPRIENDSILTATHTDTHIVEMGSIVKSSSKSGRTKNVTPGS